MSNLIINTAKSAIPAIIKSGGRNAGKILLKTALRTGVNYAKKQFFRALDTRVYDGPRLQNLHIQTSRDGAPMARVFGRVRVAGQVIWAARVKEHVKETRRGSGRGSGKGGPKNREYSYTLSFAVGLCEGEILDIGRIWADGQVLQTNNLDMRIYKGSEEQNPDPLIAEIEGENIPAFRGTAYIVFEDMPIDDFGARLPQLSFEIIRQVKHIGNKPRLEDLVQGVDLIPSSGEFVYSRTIMEERHNTRSSKPINMNNLSGLSDVDLAIDQLQAQLPNCKNISLVVSWFGDDLRASHCKLRPGVENRDRAEVPHRWKVGGLDRQSAYLVSHDENGRPNFGGTPDDNSVVELIKGLKARGFSVTFYPFILMDISSGNGLADPYGASEQAVFPWRGRITCHPAPGQSATVDKTAQAVMQIDNFFGTCDANDFSISDTNINWHGNDTTSFKRMILHYAHLAKLAGGVDAFIIGSEMRGITTVRGENNYYPAVSQLKILAQNVRTVLGAGTKISYAADWSEYFGHHPNDGSGDVFFHLDDLWADNNIDAVAIDAYFPLSDWRDGVEHLDYMLADNIYDIDYLMNNMEGGEGYDWYYKNQYDRDNQIRTQITDGAYNKPFVFRFKDVKSWWANPHYNRIGGVEQTTPTAWVAQSKPIWFSEIGCPAIDKGANQPNVFWDPKSSESYAPYYSNANRDDLIQRRYLEAFMLYWREDNNKNPISNIYNAPMVDLSQMHVWCWDARPYPDFPARKNIWSDGDNWRTGHWISGRTGLVSLADLVRETCLQVGVEEIDTSSLHGMISGYVIERPMPASAAIAPLSALYGFDAIEGAGKIRFVTRKGKTDKILSIENLVKTDENDLLIFTRLDANKRPRDVRLDYIDTGQDYQPANVLARDKYAQTKHIMDFDVPVVLDKGQAKALAEYILSQAQEQNETIKFQLPPSELNFETGDVIKFAGQSSNYIIEQIDTDFARTVLAIKTQGNLPAVNNVATPETLSDPIWVLPPNAFVLDIGDIKSDGTRQGVLVGAENISGRVLARAGNIEQELRYSVKVGVLLSDLPASKVIGRFDYANSFEIKIKADIASLPVNEVLAGGNIFAVKSDIGWEIIQAAKIEFLGNDIYRLSNLLRGQIGTEKNAANLIMAGAEIVIIDDAWRDIAINNDLRGSNIDIVFEASGRANEEIVSFDYQAIYLRPLSPVHLDAKIAGDNLAIKWIRRTRIGGDDWAAMEVALGEEREVYEIRFASNNNIFYSQTTNQEKLDININQLQAAAGSVINQIDISVCQISQTYGLGEFTTKTIQI